MVYWVEYGNGFREKSNKTSISKVREEIIGIMGTRYYKNSEVVKIFDSRYSDRPIGQVYKRSGGPDMYTFWWVGKGKKYVHLYKNGKLRD